MRKFFLLSIFGFFILGTSAQDTAKASASGWKKGGVFSLNVGQGGSRNWAAGAEKFSFSIAGYLNLFANKHGGKFTWDNSLDLGFAMVNTTTLGSRKNDDKIDLLSKFGYGLTKTLSASLLGNFRSQFRDGFDYNYLGKGYRRRVSGFFAPAYVTIAPGLDWHPTDYFSIFASPISARFIVVTNEPKSYYFQGGVIPAGDGGGFELPLSVLYGVDPGREVRSELGGFVSINFNKEVLKNVGFKSRLDLFSNYLSTYRYTMIGPDQVGVAKTGAKPQNIDVFWSNLIVMKVNKFLNVTYNFDLIYDDDVRQFGPNRNRPGTQLRSLLAVGVAAKF